MLNKVILIGRLANDPELKWTPSGIPVTTFRLAVDRPMSAEARQSGQEKQADFIDIVAWRQAAEFASNYLGKGRLVAVDGRLQIRQYVANDGTNRRQAEVIVDQLKSLERPRDAAHGPEGPEGGARAYDGPREPAENAGGAHRASAPPPNRPAASATRTVEPSKEPGRDAEADPFASDDMDDPFADP